MLLWNNFLNRSCISEASGFFNIIAVDRVRYAPRDCPLRSLTGVKNLHCEISLPIVSGGCRLGRIDIHDSMQQFWNSIAFFSCELIFISLKRKTYEFPVVWAYQKIIRDVQFFLIPEN